MSSEKNKIIIVDDHPVVLEGMSNLLKRSGLFDVIAACNDAISAINFIRKHEVDLVITDINLPDINGIDLCKKIRSEFPNTRVLGMSTFHDPSYVSEIIAAGASGFLTKNSSAREVENAVLGALKGEIIISPLIHQQSPLTFTHYNGPVLTRREKEVLKLIAEGNTNKEIAEKLFVSLNTIDSHRKNLMTKFEVMNVASLIAKAGKAGLI